MDRIWYGGSYAIPALLLLLLLPCSCFYLILDLPCSFCFILVLLQFLILNLFYSSLTPEPFLLLLCICPQLLLLLQPIKFYMRADISQKDRMPLPCIFLASFLLLFLPCSCTHQLQLLPCSCLAIILLFTSSCSTSALLLLSVW